MEIVLSYNGYTIFLIWGKTFMVNNGVRVNGI
jgi:hypothetical protein